MKEFDQLIELADRLMAPDGCPWDREQTWESLKKYTLEEVYELLDAIDGGDHEHIQEELGDVLYNVIFYCKIAEEKGLFTTPQVIQQLHDKLYYRHPHVFGEKNVESATDALASWEAMKKKEEGKQKRKNLFDGLPRELPSLIYAQKVLKRMKREGYALPQVDEEPYAQKLVALLQEANSEGVDLETSLRKLLNTHEEKYEAQEEQKCS